VQPAATLLLPREAITVPMVRASVERTLRSAGVVPDDIADLTVALTEACSNAVRHAVASSSYRVELHLGGDRCELRVVDGGPGFDLDRIEMPGPHAEGGRGLPLMRSLVDELHIEVLDGRTRVRLLKQLTSRQTPAQRADQARRVAQADERGTDDASTPPPNQEADHG
jgi:serine/threonine-protein kinase RsbW